MEELFKFLLVVAFIVIGIVTQLRKEAGKNTGKDSGKALDGMPMPDSDHPLPEPWRGDTYGGFIPEGPKPTEKLRKTSKPKKAAKPSTYSKHPSAKPSPTSQALCPQEADEAASEYGIHSAEEARKAIVWSEILNHAKWKMEG